MKSIDKEYKILQFDIRRNRSAIMGILDLSVFAKKENLMTVKNIYFIRNVAGDEVRGYHAHKRARQILYCIQGCCEIAIDNGEEKRTVRLDSIEKGVLLGSGLWLIMSHFSLDAILLVVSSEPYDEEEYIRDYNMFLKYRTERDEIENTFC